jgi:hypothetical protein
LISYLLGTGGDGEQRLGLDAVVHGILCDGGSTGHVLVRGVGARADQTDLELLGPVVGLDGLLELADGSGQIRGEGTVDVGLELREVDLNELVVLGTLVLAKLVGVLAGEVTNVLTLGGGKVVVHAVVEGEDGGGGTNLSTHVAWWLLAVRTIALISGLKLTNGGHAGSRQAVDTRTVVLNNGTSSTLDGEDTSDLEDNVWNTSQFCVAAI